MKKITKNDEKTGENSSNPPVFEEESFDSGDSSPAFDKNHLDAARSLFGPKDGVKYKASLDKVVKMVQMWDVNELMGLRSAIDNLLPPSLFSDINLLEEKRMDLRLLKKHRDEVMNDEKVAPNHVTQLISAYNAAFDAYVKLETDLYTVERVRALERAAVKALADLPKEVREEFIRVYQAEYERLRPDGG